MREISSIARKELAGFFASPVAYLFLGAFLALTLFLFFWVEAYFARNIADIRPLFEWMPILLLFLMAALTMRMWSEERRAGTLETLLTLPISTTRLALGKFLACLGLAATALLLTLPLAFAAALLGPLDWGPVAGGYLAALFLAAAYSAIGLYVSARTDNPIIALIGGVAVGGLLYLIGIDALTSLFGHRAAEILRLFSAGARFDSITRGVIDLRDLYYYVSIAALFLTLNVHTLERLRWGAGRRRPSGAADDGAARRHRLQRIAAALLIANLFAGNLWLQEIGWARADLTAGRVYSISEATRGYIDRLQEPLLVRGYFSAQTHPLLAPLTTQLRDLLAEYAEVGGDRLRVEFVDPQEDPAEEREAGERYGIRPAAFQMADRYRTAVVNSYFHILIRYGDQYEVLSHRDLIQLRGKSGNDVEVRLRNAEYDITRAIRKVLYGYQAGGNPFENLREPILLRGFISADERLPTPLPALRADLQQIVDELRAEGGEKFAADIRDPEAGGGALAKRISAEEDLRPFASGLLDAEPFYFHLLLESGGQTLPIPLPDDLTRKGLKTALLEGIKRLTPGVLRNIALYTAQPTETGADPNDPAAFQRNAMDGFAALRATLRENANVLSTDLREGRVPEKADFLLVVNPQDLDEKQVFAIDQFLMRGGTVAIAASGFDLEYGGMGLSARLQVTGLEKWLSEHGLSVRERFVLDPRNSPFPLPVQRNVGGYIVNEVRALPYPLFPDVRADGMNQQSGITAGVDQVTFNWASPITVDETKNSLRRVTPLLESSERAWSSDSIDILPDPYGGESFPVGDDRGRHLLAVEVEGRFRSLFADKPSPLNAPSAQQKTRAQPHAAATAPSAFNGVFANSPPSARIILFGSSAFLTDVALNLAMGATRTRYLNPLQLIENAIDWSLEDRSLLALRGRNHLSRMLMPLDHGEQLFWEYVNYGFALGGIALTWLLHRIFRLRRRRFYRRVLTGTTAEMAPDMEKRT